MIGSKAVTKDALSGLMKNGQIVIDLVNLDPARRPRASADYQGICW